MTVEITFSGIASFVYVVIVLFTFSEMDLKDRRVPKSILLIACISPGIEFGVYENLFLEVSIGCLIPVLLMLILGYVYYRKKAEDNTRTTPLIPFLLIGFVAVQLFALI